MGSCCGGGGWTEPPTQEYNTGKIELTMIEYFQSLGWVNIGSCGCTENYKVFTNANIPSWQVWVHAMGNTMQMRRVYGPNDIVMYNGGGTANFKETYEAALASEHQIQG